ncbi:hypothetical protein AAZX31_19G172600 [Glycine max]
MASQAPQLHFVLFPLMAPGHLLPMTDLATILAQHSNIVTVVTTPHNASRLSETFALQLQFPSQDAGLPEGCENFDMLPSMGMGLSFFLAANNFLLEPAEKVFEELTPKPNCIISDVSLAYTAHIATKFNIPRISFYGLVTSNLLESIATDSDEFVDKMAAAEAVSYGVVVNSFKELEPAYAGDFKKTRNDKVNQLDKAQRGNKASSDAHSCMKWLHLQKTNSVIYVCLGSICNLIPLQERNQTQVLNKWSKESGFEEKTKGVGLLIRGWAPQVLILSHPAIGGFITHCGWNSTLEAICASVPMLTWPLFGDQFFNEKFIVQVLRIGVRVGVESPVIWGDEEKSGVLVKKEDVVRAIEKLMDEGNEREEKRKRARDLAEMAKKAVEGGSSHFNVTQLIQDIMQQSNKN